jgi:large subunit ribosomal protein L15
VEYNEVNLDQLSAFEAGSEVTPETLNEARLLSDTRNPVVVMGRGDISHALVVRVHRVTKGAAAKIEKAGGRVELIQKQEK